MGALVGLGDAARDGILSLASGLKAEWVPGLVALGLVALLAAFTAHLLWRTRRRLAALRGLLRRIEALRGEDGLLAGIIGVDQAMTAWEEGRAPEERHVAAAWSEYRETVIEPDDGGAPSLRNTVRPALFFNVEDLGFGPGYFRILPSLFVSVGLFLTFLGLIAALDDMGASLTSDASGAATSALASLLGIASAKFIMSLTGLGCSILFTVALRRSVGAWTGSSTGSATRWRSA